MKRIFANIHLIKSGQLVIFDLSFSFSIFTAFILEAFVLEYTLSKGRKLETVLERTLKKLGFGIRG